MHRCRYQVVHVCAYCGDVSHEYMHVSLTAAIDRAYELMQDCRHMGATVAITRFEEVTCQKENTTTSSKSRLPVPVTTTPSVAAKHLKLYAP